MELFEGFLNLTAVPVVCLLLCLLTPFYWVFKIFRFTFNSLFSEDVAGKVILITGASSGIGEEIAYEYARRGAHLVLSARRENYLQEVAEKARELGSPDVLTIAADVSKVDQCQKLVDNTIRHFGKVDHLVNNAGVMTKTLFEDIQDITKIRSDIEVNLWGSIYMTKFALPYLRRSKGKIIAISSSTSWIPSPGQIVYNASKAAMTIFFETLRIECAPDIKITIVTPGLIESSMTSLDQMKKYGGEIKPIDEKIINIWQKSLLPIARTDVSAKAIVRSACRGDRNLTTPTWMKFTYYVKVLCPEILERHFKVTFTNQI